MTSQDQKSKNPPAPAADPELAQVIQAYHRVTERLERSHETLTSEVQRLQGQLASANAALQRSRRLAALGEMAAGIAHEVRNPLASIQLYAGMLRDDLADRPEQRDLAGKIGHAVRGLDAIVNDVLTFSREMKVRPVPGGVRQAFEYAVEVVRPMIDAAGVEVRYEVDHEHEDGLEVPHDPELMQQALVNVLRNAVQAMERNDAPRTLTLTAARDGGTVLLNIADTGPGIGEEAIDRIFNPFFTTRPTGTGLGLAIVHRIIDAHGGSIAVRNGPAGGAAFTITLPMETDGHDENRPLEELRSGLAESR